MRALYFLGLSCWLAGCAVNSDADCQRLCEWWQRACSAEPVSSCLEDCQDTSESAAAGLERCVDGEGWDPTPPTCQSAGCCVRFVYDDYATRCVGP